MTVLFPLLLLPSLIFLLFDSNQTLEGYQKANSPNHLYKLKSSISPLHPRGDSKVWLLSLASQPCVFSGHNSLYLSGPHPLPSVQFNSPPPRLTNSHNSKQSKQSCTGSKDVWALCLADQHAPFPPFFRPMEGLQRRPYNTGPRMCHHKVARRGSSRTNVATNHFLFT